MDGFFEGFDAGALAEAEDAEATTDSLRLFLQACEESLLAVEAPPPNSIALPTDIEGELQAECETLAKLVAHARGGDFAAVLTSPLLEPLANALTRAQIDAAIEAGGMPRLLAEIRAASDAFVAAAPPGVTPDMRRFGLLLLAVGSMQLYGHANWTGPAAKEFNGPFDIAGDADIGQHGQTILNALEVNGEDMYVLLRGPGYLWLACALLGILQASKDAVEMPKDSGAMASGQTLAIWRGRCAYMWQLSIADASERGHGQCPWLFKLCIDDLVGTQDSSGPLALPGFLGVEMVAAVRGITAPTQYLARCRGQVACSSWSSHPH